uniref:Putative secreted protein n=1 Tax=Anopheles darlingi TaxID=43151 RepID=A0A2M4D1I9_ANODA
MTLGGMLLLLLLLLLLHLLLLRLLPTTVVVAKVKAVAAFVAEVDVAVVMPSSVPIGAGAVDHDALS